MTKAILICIFASIAMGIIALVKKAKKSSARSIESYKSDKGRYAHFNDEKTDFLYEIPALEDCHCKLLKGNTKTGESVYTFSLLSGGCKGITLQCGARLWDTTKLCGSCSGCSEGICDSTCYALKYMMVHHNSIIPRYIQNTNVMYNDMIRGFAELQSQLDADKRKKCHKISAVRIHASGEFFSFEYLMAWIEFARVNSHMIFYTYTKRYAWLERAIIACGGHLPTNFIVNVSVWENPVTGEKCTLKSKYDFLGEFIYDDSNIDSRKEASTAVHCKAVNKDGSENKSVKCETCKRCMRGISTACWSH